MSDWLPYAFVIAMVVFFFATRVAGKVAPAEARRLVGAGARLVDVRSPGEFATGHLDGAVNIPLDQIERRATEIGPKDQPVVLYCRSGARSGMAAGTLKKLGWSKVSDLGAMSRW